MSHRPPKYPLPQGVVWHHFTAGMAAGAPLAEWAYVTPTHPFGLPESKLKYSPESDQEVTARFWFFSNYQPFINDGRYFGFGPANAGFEHGVWAPENWTPDEILTTEFKELLPETMLFAFSTELKAVSARWKRLPYEPPSWIFREQPRNVSDDVSEAFSRLEVVVKAMRDLHGKAGHNQGPPLLDQEDVKRLNEAIPSAQGAISEGAVGVAEVETQRVKFIEVAKSVGNYVLKGLSLKAGEDAYSPAKQLAVQLFHRLMDLITVLAHWLSSIQ